MLLRKPQPNELNNINAMIMRSKAHWGYDAEFINACRTDLAFNSERLASELVRVTVASHAVTGVIEVSINGHIAEIYKLFVDPLAIGSGTGRMLYQWGMEIARNQNASRLMIESDPFAQGFYEQMGAQQVGEVASGSIEGRFLPLLQHNLEITPEVGAATDESILQSTSHTS